MTNRSNFQLPSDRLPPQNIEAEEAILGGILLDPEAISRVAELLDPSCFAIKAHQTIYRTTLNLHFQGKPTDLMTVTTWLDDHNQLEEVGGQMKLAQLVDRTVSAVNIDQYALLVIEKAMRRNLIQAGHETIDLGYDTTIDIEDVLDRAEQKIFNITQVRPQQNLISIAETLINTFQDIEDRHEGVALPGLNCDFYDLDAMTGGFQRSDLVIVAGRPSMGKTALCTNISYNIAKIHRLPVAIFSLEMSKEQLVQRLLSSEAKIESNRLRSGRISQTEWEPLTVAIGTLSELQIFIDDTPNITVTEMRSKVRRLQAEQGGAMGLVLIDYLQLMEGSNSDNRVQELSRITRSLKGLARELNTPVIALSQLSRSVESRTNKRPMMSDLRESGCLAGDSLITLAYRGLQVPIRELVGKSGFLVWAINQATLKLEKAVVSNAFSTGIKPVFRLKTRLGRTVKATGNHQFLTVYGWQRLDELNLGCAIAVPRCLASSDLQLMSDTELGFLAERTGKLAQVVKSKTVALLAESDIYWDEIVAIEPIGETEVYDLTVPGLHNFIANNIVVHNSIEQDADLVIMLYRDDYYNPDSPDRGIAEVIITKHRNGPTGTIKLLFDPQFTKFRNLAGGDRYLPGSQSSHGLPPAH
ncbi:replicative DNA helicase [Capilliphycus salinus ALCB114379]|uniref:replicative DNA helicase n=1 Tax=Capilliphycus salinus TaxID=2768948 RepID=UPI0039A6B129